MRLHPVLALRSAERRISSPSSIAEAKIGWRGIADGHPLADALRHWSGKLEKVGQRIVACA